MVSELNVSELLRSQLKPVLGCTEPAAVGLATAIARQAIDGVLPDQPGTQKPTSRKEQAIIEDVLIEVDRDVYKNSYSVGIPGTGGQSGIFIASALGLFCNPDKKLLLFQDSDKEKIAAANELVKGGKIKLKVVDDWKGDADINIKATVRAKKENAIHEGVAVIKHTHTNVVFISHNGKTLFEIKEEKKGNKSHFDKNMVLLSKSTLKEMIRLAENLSEDDKHHIYNGILMNQKAYLFGLKDESGLGIGAKWKRLMDSGKIKQDIINQAKSKTAAAEDARMSGQNVEIMGTAGSGSHGIAMSVPIIAVAEEVDWNKDKLTNAVALSNFVTLYLCYYSGYLSALCGCVVKSGVGASAGVAYYLGGKEKEIGAAIKNMTGDITGVICDGAKIGCAVKLATSAGAAVQNALLALEGVEIPSNNGIVSESVEETMKNIGKISKGMVSTDKSIVEIMDGKTCH